MDNERIDWLDKHSDATRDLANIAYDLTYLASSFRATGNLAMQKHLLCVANNIDSATKDIRNAMTASIKESMKRSTESSKNLLAASLAGAMIAKKDILKKAGS